MSKRDDSQLIVALARGATYRAAADASGFSERTVNRRMQDADFRRQVEGARRELLNESVGRLIDAAQTGVNVLKQLAESADSESVKCSAARALVGSLIPLWEKLNLEDRISELEQRFNERN